MKIGKKLLPFYLTAALLLSATGMFAFAADTSADYSVDMTAGSSWNISTLDVGLTNDASVDNSLVAVVNGKTPIINAEVAVPASNRYLILTMMNGTDSTGMSFYFRTKDGDAVVHEIDGAERVDVAVSAGDTEFKTYVVDMYNSYWTHTITYLRFDLFAPGTSTDHEGNIYIKRMIFSSTDPNAPDNSQDDSQNSSQDSGADSSIEPSQTPDSSAESKEEEKCVLFDFSQDQQGWAGENAFNACTVGMESGALKASITGLDSFIVSAETSIPAEYRYMVIRMKNASPANAMQVYFAVASKDDITGDKCVTFSTTPNETGYSEYVVDMSSHAAWKDTIKLIRLDLSDNTTDSGTVSIQSIKFTGTRPSSVKQEAIVYDFSKGNAGFSITHDLASYETKNGATTAVYGGMDPFILSPYGLGVDADRYKFLHITAKVDADISYMTLYFVTDKFTEMSLDKTALIEVSRSGDFMTYTVDMSQNSLWKGTVTQIRLDLNDEIQTSGNVALKSIMFSKQKNPAIPNTGDTRCTPVMLSVCVLAGLVLMCAVVSMRRQRSAN